MTDSLRKVIEDAMRNAGRLPPGQVLTEKFPVLHFGSIPPFDSKSWNFKSWGEVEKPLVMDWDAFSQLPRKKVKLDLHCVTRWSKLDTEWEGVSLQMLMDAGLVQLKPAARFVMLVAENDFSANLPLDVALSENFLLATHYDGQPLTPQHGYPLRAVVGAIPGRDDLKDVYFWKGAKWLRGIEFLPEDRKGFWEMAGYHNEGDIWKEQRMEEE